jgi:hypothetical protein
MDKNVSDDQPNQPDRESTAENIGISQERKRCGPENNNGDAKTLGPIRAGS